MIDPIDLNSICGIDDCIGRCTECEMDCVGAVCICRLGGQAASARCYLFLGSYRSVWVE